MSFHDDELQDYQRTLKEFFDERKRPYDSRNIWDIMRENPRVVLRYPTLDSILFNNSRPTTTIRQEPVSISMNEYKERYHLPDNKFKILFEIEPPLIFAEHPVFMNLIDLLDKLKKENGEIKRLLRKIKEHFINYIEKPINISNLINFISIFITNLLLLNKENPQIEQSTLNEIKYYTDIILAYLLNYLFTTQKLEYISSHVLPFNLDTTNNTLNPMTFNIFINTLEDKYPRLFDIDAENKDLLIIGIVDNASRIFGKPLRPSSVSRLGQRILKSSRYYQRH